MATTTFVDNTTPVVASWLNDVNAVVYGSAAPPANPIRVDLAGNFGLGITPTEKLHVSGTLKVNSTSVWHRFQAATAVANWGVYSTSGGADLAYIGGGAGAAISSGTANDFAVRAVSGNLILSASSGADVTLTPTGNLLITGSTSSLGYGVGSGGSVTQATSKSTTVTLNKANGLITMNAAALAAGATVAFNLSNTLLAVGDHVIANLNFASNNYDVKVFFVGANVCAIAVKNITAGSLSEAVTIDFAIIKGSTS